MDEIAGGHTRLLAGMEELAGGHTGDCSRAWRRLPAGMEEIAGANGGGGTSSRTQAHTNLSGGILCFAATTWVV
jgi:hypothetical protein